MGSSVVRKETPSKHLSHSWSKVVLKTHIKSWILDGYVFTRKRNSEEKNNVYRLEITLNYT